MNDSRRVDCLEKKRGNHDHKREQNTSRDVSQSHYNTAVNQNKLRLKTHRGKHPPPFKFNDEPPTLQAMNEITKMVTQKNSCGKMQQRKYWLIRSTRDIIMRLCLKWCDVTRTGKANARWCWSIRAVQLSIECRWIWHVECVQRRIDGGGCLHSLIKNMV